MSGVYIKGMEMPESCYYCPFMDGSWGYSPPHKARCVITGKDMPIDERGCQYNQSCPLVPAPPHGRLIDADVLCELCDIMADKCDDIGASIWNQFRVTVECSPTVIPKG